MRSLLAACMALAFFAPVAAQQRYPGPDPADQTVIRPGKLIGAPKEEGPAGGTSNTGNPGTTKPGGNTNPANPGSPGAGAPPNAGGGGTAGGLAPPPSLTAATGLRIARWVTFHRITHFRQPDMADIEQCRISADGSKIAFAAYSGIFTLNADGSGLVRLSDKINNNPGIVDLSADGRTVVWTDGRTGGLFVSASDGSRQVKLPVTSLVISARITADGRRVFVLSPEVGILSMATDGSPARPVMTTAIVCRLLGIDENGNHWRGWPSGLDISADGSRVVFHLLWDAFAMNGDGSGLRRLTQYMNPEDRMLNFVRISADGRRVATYHQQKGITVQDWEGGNVVTHGGDTTREGRWMQLSGDGAKVLLSWGLRIYDGSGPGKVELSEWGGDGDQPMYYASNATITADARRACVVVKDQGCQQLEIVDFFPTTLEGVPAIADLKLTPRFILANGSNQATATARVSGPDVARVGITGLRDGFRFPDWSPAPAGEMNDAGKNGDGFFRISGVRLIQATPKLPAAGPITLRFFAWNKQKNALVVDVEGFEAR